MFKFYSNMLDILILNFAQCLRDSNVIYAITWLLFPLWFILLYELFYLIEYDFNGERRLTLTIIFFKKTI